MGKVIALDNHRLLCGDAENKEDVDCLIGGVKIDLLITDPPYGIDIVKVIGERERERALAHSLDTSSNHQKPFKTRNSGNTSKTRIPQERERERANGKVGKPRRCTAKIIQTSYR